METATASEPVMETSPTGRQVELFPLPTDEAFLDGLLRDLFENHWAEITFGPMIQGAAYEIQCSEKPHKIGLLDGYLTIFFGPSHFHLCIGENLGSPASPTPPALREHRRTRQAHFFRSLGPDGAPMTWGLRLINGGGEEQMTLFFPNPFLTDDDQIATQPDWSRLGLWEAMLRRYLAREPDGKDRQGKGFSHCG